MNDVIVGALIAAVPLALSNLVTWKQGERAREHEAAEARRQRAEVRASERRGEKRRKYEEFLQAAHEISTQMQQADGAYSGLREGEPPAPPWYGPEPALIERLSRGAAGAVLEAPESLAEKIQKVHDDFTTEIALHLEMGRAQTPYLDPALIREIRQGMREDIDSTVVEAGTLFPTRGSRP